MEVAKDFKYIQPFDEDGNPIPLPANSKYPLTIIPLRFDKPVQFKDGKAIDVSELAKAKGTDTLGQRPTANFTKPTGNTDTRNQSHQDSTSDKGVPTWMTEAAELARSTEQSVNETTQADQIVQYDPTPCIRANPAVKAIPVIGRTTTQTPSVVVSNPKEQASGNAAKSIAPKAYDLATELMRKLPMRMVNEALYVYNGKAYEFVSSSVMYRLIMAHCRGAVSTVGDASVIKRVYEVIQAEPAIFIRDIKNLDLVSFENGLLDLGNFKLYPHTPEVFITAQVEGEFHPELSPACPVFDRFLFQTAGGDTTLVQRSWESIGYLLTPDTRGKAFVLFQGARDSGKSLLGDFISSLLRPEDVTAIALDELGERL